MFTIIYSKETGTVLNITSESNAEKLRSAIPQTSDFIFVESIPNKDFYRQEYVVVNGCLVVRNLALTLEQEKEITKIEYNDKILELKKWFESVYTYKVQKYNRLSALGKLDDDGVDAQIKLGVLYQEAETKRLQIQALEKALQE